MTENVHEGHRKRMLERIAAGGDSMQDHELLEALLFYAIPRKNTNPAAHRLLRAFGSLNAVLHASEKELSSVEGIGGSTAAFLRLVGQIYDKIPSGQEKRSNAQSLNDFKKTLQTRFAGRTTETLECYLIDERYRIKYMKEFTSESRTHAAVSIREIGRLISEYAPRGVILAHNHPTAGCAPSTDDDRFTAQVQTLCAVCSCALLDHVIMGEDGQYSYFASGRLQTLKDRFNLESVLNQVSKVFDGKGSDALSAHKPQTDENKR